MKTLTPELLISMTRKILAMGGTWLVQRGFMNETDMLELTGGLALILVSVAWTWYQGHQNARLLDVAIAVPAGTSVTTVKAIAAEVR